MRQSNPSSRRIGNGIDQDKKPNRNHQRQHKTQEAEIYRKFPGHTEQQGRFLRRTSRDLPLRCRSLLVPKELGFSCQGGCE